ncbi:MAG: hypothetical protein J6328_03800 [Bacilli bacterium]|nr:hypothetical protein [Bacilli bacterium]
MESEKKLILDVNESPKKKGQWIILAIQHVLAMFVACITVPAIVFQNVSVTIDGASVSLAGLMIAPTILSAGIGTLFYLFATKRKSPMFLASSFAYMDAMAVAIKVDAGETGNVNLWILPIGMFIVGLIYVLVAFLVKTFGTAWINKLLPPIVIGPVIMVIGLGLAGSAVGNLTGTLGAGYNWCYIIAGLVAMIVTALCAHYGKKTISLIPFVLGMCAGYIVAVLFTVFGYYIGGADYFRVVNFDPIVNNWTNITFESFIGLPRVLPYVAAVSKNVVPFSGTHVLQALLIFAPVSLVTICEHIGDHKNMSGVIDRDLIKEPGLSRTLIGDGVATALSGGLCGAANTTYGENVAVVGVTKVASVSVLMLACCFTIGLSFFSPLMTVVQTIPACVTGGVSLILYGFIAASGVKMLINEKIDFGNTKNIFVASVILVAGIGGLAFTFGNPDAPVAKITSTAVAMILGVCMNFMLKDKKVEVVEESKAE